MQKFRSSKIVLTGGPCAGKTTLTQIIARTFPESVAIVPEAASILFAGGFPRLVGIEETKITQRAIFQLQKNLEDLIETQYPHKILVLDRGTIDGAAYWPSGTDDFFAEMQSSLDDELGRYDQVIFLESALAPDYKTQPNGLRIESWERAQELGQFSKMLWQNHRSFKLVRNERSFEKKIAEVLQIVSAAVRDR